MANLRGSSEGQGVEGSVTRILRCANQCTTAHMRVVPCRDGGQVARAEARAIFCQDPVQAAEAPPNSYACGIPARRCLTTRDGMTHETVLFETLQSLLPQQACVFLPRVTALSPLRTAQSSFILRTRLG
jgi:hypothetical protein